MTFPATPADCPPPTAQPVLATRGALRDRAADPRTAPPLLPTRVAVVTTVLIAVLTALAAATTLAASADEGARTVGLDVAVAVAAVAAYPLLWTRRPVPAALVLAVLAALSPAATPAATAATLQVARWRPVPTALLVAVAGVVGHGVQALWRPVSLPLGWWLLCDVAVHAALLGWGAYWQERAAVIWSLRDRARRAEADQERRLAEARTAERTRIAREMHDTLAHRLSLLASTAGALEYRPDADPALLAVAAGRVRAGVSDALEDLRQVIRLLRTAPDDLGPAPRLDDVATLVDEARAAGGDVRYELTPAADDAAHEAGRDMLPPQVAVAVYRVVQEGLTNARKHAPGAAVRVAVHVGDRDVRVRVTDDGARDVDARPPGPGTGTGLVGLRERATLLGGRVETGPRASGGFALEAWLPWD
ncbi:sensor histidine kinase [Isoptericola sp. NEAU-Y5]|uniref:histidine kinase n=1 Tax=Isoptericola luteus TaxID=2879484 RepID=A0ABS7ZGU8_9MICO|nr:sensor histidine kinase [Isoptericola sp. NEAU-Y5]MCA5894254.1 sensor histidine kinase [Isoptericola sp. NEAU-Y5]